MESARKKASRLGVSDICSFTTGTAESTGQQDNFFDLVFVGTAWHWFDPVKACQEILRILKPGGYLIINTYT